MTESKALALSGQGALQLTTLSDAKEFAEMVADSAFVPAAYRGKPGDVVIAMQLGAELGLAPMQALQNVAVINGRPSVWGDAILAIISAHPACEDIVESISGYTATCTVKRRGRSVTTRTFSVDDAKRAGLWGKKGPWQQYPKRMLQMRARGFALRDAFPDALCGMISSEEAEDTPPKQGAPIYERAEALPKDEPADFFGVSEKATAIITKIQNSKTKEELGKIIDEVSTSGLEDGEKGILRTEFTKQCAKLGVDFKKEPAKEPVKEAEPEADPMPDPVVEQSKTSSIEVASSDGTTSYTVTTEMGVPPTCTCKAFEFCKAPKTCRHILEVTGEVPDAPPSPDDMPEWDSGGQGTNGQGVNF